MDRPLAPDAQLALQELKAGFEFWNTKLKAKWPADFHNAEYKTWATEDPDFSDNWWEGFCRRLRGWKALRPVSNADVTTRFLERRDALAQAWATHCVPYLDLDISDVTWAQVGGFADLVGEIKPMKHCPSLVFTSKFCHFLLPKVFPVVDNEGSGNRWRRYEHYFDHVQSLWTSTPDETRTTLIAAMTEAIEHAGASVSPEFPLISKIVELRSIGQHHPSPDLPRVQTAASRSPNISLPPEPDHRSRQTS